MENSLLLSAHAASRCTVTLLATLASFCCIIIPSLTFACSPPTGDFKPPSLHDRIHNFTNVVVYGRVMAHHPDTVYNYGTPNLFTAEVEVYCTYKGGPLPQYINITGAGHIPGMCHHTRLSLGKEYLVMLSQMQAYLEPREIDVEMSGPTDANFDPFKEVCGLTLDYPLGVEAADRKRECPLAKDCTLAQNVDANHEEIKEDKPNNAMVITDPNAAIGLSWYKINIVLSLIVTLLFVAMLELL